VKPVNKLKEQLLLVRIQKAKDADAFSQLYDHLADPIYRFVYFKVSDVEVAKDLTADIFLKSWKELTNDKTSQVKHLKAFIYVVARNRVIDHYRKSARQQDVPLEHYSAQDKSENTHKQVELNVDAEKILLLTHKLKDSYKEVILLRHVDQLSLREIAQVIDKTPVAARVLLHRAQKALQREYEKVSENNSKSV